MNDFPDTGRIRDMKKMIRTEMLKRRKSLSEEERAAGSEIICQKFLESEEYRDARTILLYKSYNCEVCTDLIFERAVSDKKTVAYPISRITDGIPELVFYITDDASVLTEGYKGIYEPDTSKARIFQGKADVCIVPGSAFDSRCHRIGYGKSFYDRYLRDNRPEHVIGLAFSVQIADDFETEECDIDTDAVITDKEVYINER